MAKILANRHTKYFGSHNYCNYIIYISDQQQYCIRSVVLKVVKNEHYYLLECDALQSRRRSLTFQGKYCLYLHGRRVSQVSNKQVDSCHLLLTSSKAYSTTLKIRALHSSEISRNFYQTTWLSHSTRQYS
jgi:hypothetical protein